MRGLVRLTRSFVQLEKVMLTVQTVLINVSKIHRLMKLIKEQMDFEAQIDNPEHQLPVNLVL